MYVYIYTQIVFLTISLHPHTCTAMCSRAECGFACVYACTHAFMCVCVCAIRTYVLAVCLFIPYSFSVLLKCVLGYVWACALVPCRRETHKNMFLSWSTGANFAVLLVHTLVYTLPGNHTLPCRFAVQPHTSQYCTEGAHCVYTLMQHE